MTGWSGAVIETVPAVISSLPASVLMPLLVESMVSVPPVIVMSEIDWMPSSPAVIVT